jgi:hypothetical protein
MKQLLSLLTFAVLMLLFSCSGKNKDAGVDYGYVEKVPELSAELQERIGSWAEEGAACYGILALLDGEGEVQEGAVIKAKLIRFRGDSIKMKSLVDLKLREVEGCDKMGISRGETWWETEGDIYLTEEEAAVQLAAAMDKVKF